MPYPRIHPEQWSQDFAAVPDVGVVPVWRFESLCVFEHRGTWFATWQCTDGSYQRRLYEVLGDNPITCADEAKEACAGMVSCAMHPGMEAFEHGLSLGIPYWELIANAKAKGYKV
jgi:hypothetical protein